MDHIHTATAFNRLGLLVTAPDAREALRTDARLSRLLLLLQGQAHRLNAQGVSNTLWAAARLAPAAAPIELVATLEARALVVFGTADEHAFPQAISNTAWAHARLVAADCTPVNARLLACLAGAADAVGAARFSPQPLSNLVWAFATARYAPPIPGWLDRAWAAAVATAECDAPAFRPQELALALWAFAKLQHAPDPVSLRLMASRLGGRAAQCDAQALSNGLYALAVMGLGHGGAPRAVSALVASYAALMPQVCRPQSVCLLMWSLPLLGNDPGAQFVTAALGRVLAMGAAVRAADVAQLCAGLVALRYTPGPKSLDALALLVDREVHGFSAPQLATVMGAFVRFGVDLPADQGRRLAARVAELGGGISLEGALDALGCAHFVVR